MFWSDNKRSSRRGLKTISYTKIEIEISRQRIKVLAYSASGQKVNLSWRLLIICLQFSMGVYFWLNYRQGIAC